MSRNDAHRQPPATVGAMVRYSLIDFGLGAHPLRAAVIERGAAARDGVGLGDAIDGAIVRGTDAHREAVVRRCRRGLLVLSESTRWDVDRERLVAALEMAVRACESCGAPPAVEMARLSSPVDADGAPVRATSD